jgi:hypothetical protein
MGRSPFSVLLILLVMLSACTSDPSASGPRLVQNVTLEPTAIMPTRIQTATPIVIPIATSERISPLEVATVEGRFPEFVLITPTLPPSKTPTPTATITSTATSTRPPTQTVPPPLFPTYVMATPDVFSPAVNPGVNPVSGSLNCTAEWFFRQPIPMVCPLAQPIASTAAYQQFQQGFMIWVGQQDMIYTVYDSIETPRWQMFRDNYEDGMPEYDPALWVDQPAYTWQPRRGFGLIWRDNPGVQRRLGWAVREWEEPYDIRLQISLDGSIFLTDPRGGIIVLQTGGRDWNRYANP